MEDLNVCQASGKATCGKGRVTGAAALMLGIVGGFVFLAGLYVAVNGSLDRRDGLTLIAVLSASLVPTFLVLSDSGKRKLG